ncbi:MAG: hypothetical protein PHG18_05420 [Bacilli bacterium]|nr:hypothetical protein [Bacilli bacterium]
MFSKNESNNNAINQEEPSSIEKVNSELSNIKNIIGNITDGYEHLYDNQDFLNSINELKALGATNIISNIDPQNQTYCLSLVKDDINLCIDNDYIGNIDVSYCGRDNIACIIPFEEEPIIEEEEAPINEEEPIIEEETPIYEEDEVVEGPELVLKEEVKVKNNSISIYENKESSKIVFINEKEFGPYSQAYITHNENEWGLLMNYNNKWYVNINGKAFGPYLEKPTVEFYGENIGFSYIKDNKYYINLNNQIHGPYDDLTEFDLNEE